MVPNRGNQHKKDPGSSNKSSETNVWSQRRRRETLDHRQTLFNKLGWLNTTQMTNRATIQNVYKAINNNSSEELNNMFYWKKAESKRYLAQTYLIEEGSSTINCP